VNHDLGGSQSATESAIAVKAEKITSLINGSGNHLGGGDRYDKSPSVTASLERSELKASKSKDASQPGGGGASQSV